MKNLVVFCADIGSIKNNNFGWAASFYDGRTKGGSSIVDFANEIAQQIIVSNKVALGFECPLFVPVRANPEAVNSARHGEGNRSWSAGAGAGSLATGLVEVLWVLNAISEILGYKPNAELSWDAFLENDGVFLWEAFITSSGKGRDHADDAKIAVQQFNQALPNPEQHNAINEPEVLSLVGAAALRSGWSKNITILSQPCVVIKA